MAFQEFPIRGGLNLAGAADRIGDGELSVAVGCQYDNRGSVQSDKGRSIVFEDLGINSEDETEKVNGSVDGVLDGVRFRFLKVGDDLYRNDELIDTGGWTGGKLTGVTYNGFMYLTDGAKFQRYSTNLGVQDVGYETPTVAPTSVTATGGNLTLNATYKWVYTHFNGVAESNFSPPLEHTMLIASRGRTLSIPAAPAGTIESRIYRTDANQNHYFFVGIVEGADAGTFTDLGKYTSEIDGLTLQPFPGGGDPAAVEGDDVVDAPRVNVNLTAAQRIRFGNSTVMHNLSKNRKQTRDPARQELVQTNLGVLANWTDHDPPPAGLHSLTFVNEVMFACVGNEIAFTSALQPEHWSEYNRIPIGRQAGDSLRTIVRMGDVIAAYTDTSIWLFRYNVLDPAQSSLEQANTPVGSVSRHAVSDIFFQGGQFGGHIFLANNGIHTFDGQGAVLISDQIKDIFEDVSHPDHMHPNGQANAVAGTVQDRVFISYSTRADAVNDRTLVINISDQSSPKFSILRWGFCSLERHGDNRLFGGSTDGKLYELNAVGGGIVEWEVRTKSFPIAGFTVPVAPEFILIDANLGGADTTITLESPTRTLATFTLTKTLDGRKKYRRLVPFFGAQEQFSVRLKSTSDKLRELFTVGFGTDEVDIA